MARGKKNVLRIYSTKHIGRLDLKRITFPTSKQAIFIALVHLSEPSQTVVDLREHS